MTACDFLDDLHEGRIVEFIAAEEPGLHDAVEASLEKPLMDLVGVMAPFVARILLGPQQEPQGLGAPDQGLGR